MWRCETGGRCVDRGAVPVLDSVTVHEKGLRRGVLGKGVEAPVFAHEMQRNVERCQVCLRIVQERSINSVILFVNLVQFHFILFVLFILFCLFYVVLCCFIYFVLFYVVLFYVILF